MDPLTHTLTGLFLSRAGLKRWTPHAAPILMLAANAPDIDIVTARGGWLDYLQYHRHVTHSLAAMPVMAILPVLLIGGVFRKRVQWGGAFAAALIAVASHLLLDYTNVYGIRLFLPFSSQWERLDVTGVVDPWIWAVLLLGLAAPWLARLVGSEISSGTLRPTHYGRGWAILALCFLLLYDGGRGVLHARAVALLESRLYEGEAPLRVLAVPGANPLAWRGVAETREFYEVVDVDLGSPLNLARGEVLSKPAPGPELAAARQTITFQKFLTFVQFPVWRITPDAQGTNGKRVELVDIRFGTPSQPGFRATALLNGENQVMKTSFVVGVTRPR